MALTTVSDLGPDAFVIITGVSKGFGVTEPKELGYFAPNDPRLLQFEVLRRDEGGILYVYGGPVADLRDEDLPLKEGDWLAVANAFNEQQLRRADDELRRAKASPYSETAAVQADVKYYEGVLGYYWRWYRKHDIPFPIDHPIVDEDRGREFARAAYPHLSKARNINGLARLALGPFKDKGEAENAERNFRRRLEHYRFYVPGKKANAIKFAECCQRIRDYVERGVEPGSAS